MIQSPIAISANAVAAHYDSLDVFYRQVWGEHVHHGYWETGRESTEEAVLHLSRVLAAWLELKPGASVCDIGCGYGGTSRFLAENNQAHVTGYTLSQRQKAYADSVRVQNGSVAVHCRDFMQNREPDESFDAVISVECIEHMADKRALFQEAFRILKPGGSLALAVWSSCEDPNRLQKSLLEKICEEGRLPSLLSGDEYAEQMRRAGFSIEERREIGTQVRKTWALCAGQLSYKIVTDSSYRSFLRDSRELDKVFAMTVFRILTAFYSRTMRYWIFHGKKGFVRH